MISLWTLFVENVFGSFWASVVGIVVLLYIIMAYMGSLSNKTIMEYLLFFVLAMCLGYSIVMALFICIITLYFDIKTILAYFR